MHAPRHVRLALTVLSFLLVVAIGCSKGNEGAGPGTSVGAGTPAPTTTVPLPPPTGVEVGIIPECNTDILTPVAQVAYPGGILTDIACTPPFAMATVGGGGLKTDAVVLLRVVNDAWTVVANGEADQVDTLVPADYSSATVSAWKTKRTLRLNPKAPKPTLAPGATPVVRAQPSTTCVQSDDSYLCDEVPTIPPTPATPPPTGPDGKPLPTAPPATSMFCRFNFADPRCVADPQFPG
jgi:hypothetical protein